MPSTITDRASGLGTGATPNGENATVSQKVPCRVATTVNITLSGLQTLDTVTVVADDRVLVKNQTDASENGIYLASADAWQRTADAADAGDLVKGSQVRVNEGSVGPGTWYCTSSDPIVIGTDDITWVDAASTDLSGAEIKALYETEADTNAYTDAELVKVGHLTVTAATDLDAIRTRVTDLDESVVLRGTWDASSGSFPGGGTAQAGDSYIVSVAGTVDSVTFAVNERIIAITDNASTAVFAANWFQQAASGEDIDYDTKSDLEAATVGASINVVRINGYTSVGDGGGASYKRVVSEPSHDGKIQSNDGAWWELAENRVTPQMFGAIADGATNALAAFASALVFVAGSALYVPAGNYQLDFTTTTALTLPENTSVIGEGRDATSLVFTRSDDTFRVLFGTNDGINFRGLSCEFENDGTSSDVMFFSIGGSQFSLLDCAMDGNMTNVGSVLSHDAYLLGIPESGTFEDIHVERNTITGFSFAFLKTNTSTATERRIKVLNNDFYENYKSELSFNSPNGVCDDVIVRGNTHRDNLGISASVTSPLLIAFAGVTNFRCEGNNLEGECLDAIHIEEACVGGVVIGNTIDCDCTAAIMVIDNDVAGSYTRPADIAISANRIKKSGTQKESGSFGIDLANDGLGINACEKFTITNNVIEGFDKGVFTAGTETIDGIEVANNFVTGCSEGFKIGYDSASVHDNTTKDCDVGIYSNNGAMIVRHRFIDDTVPVDAVQRPAMLVDPVFVYSSFAITASTRVDTDVIAMGSNSRMYGIGHSYVSTEGASHYSSIATEYTWDGTTLTQVAKATIQPGASTVTFDVSGGNFRFRTFSSIAATTARISFKLNGSMTIAV